MYTKLKLKIAPNYGTSMDFERDQKKWMKQNLGDAGV